jgi:glucose-6-phosphate isomerase
MTDYKFSGKHFAEKSYEQMKDVLMSPDSEAPEIFYYMCRGGKEQKNITVWEPGTVGGEYIKTYGHYHIGDTEETYWVLFGEGVALLQKPKFDSNGQVIDGDVEEFKVVLLKPGDEIHMPQGWGHVVINVGKTAFVTADDTDVNFDDSVPPKTTGHADYESVKRMRGFAYYVVEENGQVVLKKNTNYNNIDKVDFGGLTATSEV